MKVIIAPHIDHLMVFVNSFDKLSSGISLSAISKLYAPWPQAQEKGFVEIDIEGNTLRELLTAIGASYKKVNIDLEPICSRTNEVKPDYDVFVNGQSFAILDKSLESVLKDGDQVKIMADTQGFC
jgi:hypothetical protein